MAVLSSPIPRLVAQLPSVQHAALLGSVKAIRRDAERVAARVAGGDGRLSNAGKKGARLTTRDRYRRGLDTAPVWAVPPGPWRWVTDGTGPHLIGAGRTNRRTGNYAAARFRRRKALRIGERWVTGPIFHPGTSGKGAWTMVVRDARRSVPAEFSEAFGRWARG